MKQLTAAQIANMRHAGKVLADTFIHIRQNLHAGMTTREVDKIAEDYILSRQCYPCFKGVYDYQYACNTSVNDEIIHGMPSNKVLHEGDILTVDCGVGFNGICTDACRTFAVGKISAEAQELINVTRNCFYRAVEKIRPGAEVSVVGKTIESYIDRIGGYSILENYCGHGIGKNLHEDPLIPNYVVRNSGLLQHVRKKFQSNTAICVEPMIFHGENNKVKVAADGWTVISTTGALSAHYENTILITANGVEILTNSDEK